MFSKHRSCPSLDPFKIEKLTTDSLNRWRNKLALAPKRVRSKKGANEPATRETPDDDDARRARKATANRILTMLKAALNRAFIPTACLLIRVAQSEAV